MKEDSILKEVNELLTLLESISENENEIEKSIQKTIKRRYAFTLLFSLAIISIIYLSTYSTSTITSNHNLLILSTIILVGFTFIMELKNNIDEMRKLKSKIEMEVEIKHRIISIIHNQISRLDQEDLLSPILHATIEMRLRRAAQNL